MNLQYRWIQSMSILNILDILDQPPCHPTQFAARKDKTKSTKVNPENVVNGRVPRRLELAQDVFTDLDSTMRQFLSSPSFPGHLFGPNDDIGALQKIATRNAQRITPPGEHGLSHFLAIALFEKINCVLVEVFTDETRFWKAIGIGSSGKPDWGLYLNGVLVSVVELKPHIVGVT